MEANGQPHAAAAFPSERSERSEYRQTYEYSVCTENCPNPEDGYTETDPNEV
jgi:hypothetical protein